MKIKQDENSVSCIWDASIVLSRYMLNESEFPRGFFKNKQILELGSGCGLSGIISAFLGASTILTELGDVMPILKENVERLKQFESKFGEIDCVVEELFWGNFKSYDF